MEKISVIVPVYNVEKYLEKCVDSIVNQTYTNLEIILVDDGATDSSGKLCDELAEKDARIRVIHKENGGLSSARNVGIEHSTGEYLGFVDSDDFIEPDMYEVLYHNLVAEGADISMCGLVHYYEGTTSSASNVKEYCVWDTKEAVHTVMEAKKTSVTAVNKLYKKSIFSQIRYPLNKLSEDAFVIIEVLLQAKKIVFTSEQKYNYIHRKNSITTSEFKEKDLDVIEAYQKNYQLIMEHFPDLESTAKMRCMWANFYVIDKWILSSNPQRMESIEKIVRNLKENYHFIMHDTRFNRTRKIAMTLLMIHFDLYKICVLATRKKYID